MLQLHHHVTLDGALDLVFRLSQDLFGIAIVRVDDTANGKARFFWNYDARFYHIYYHSDDDDDVDDISTTANKESKQKYLGSFFVDLYQRPGKMHGWSGHIPLYATTTNGATMGRAGSEKEGGAADKANADDEEDAAIVQQVMQVSSWCFRYNLNNPCGQMIQHDSRGHRLESSFHNL
jgi:Peptidase family M3